MSQDKPSPTFLLKLAPSCEFVSSFKSTTSTQPDNSTLPKAFVCAECGKSFPRNSRLRIHERKHVSFNVTHRPVNDLTNATSGIAKRNSARKEI